MKYEWKSGIITVLMFLVLGIGVSIGNSLFTSPETIQATSTDRLDGRIMASGGLVDGLEAVYLLEQNTGRLSAGVLHRESQSFQGLYETNVNAELARILQSTNASEAMPQNPKYTMVTGQVSVPRIAGAGWQAPQAMIYVHEMNTGYVMVFALPWEKESWLGGQAKSGPLTLWAFQPFCKPMQ